MKSWLNVKLPQKTNRVLEASLQISDTKTLSSLFFQVGAKLREYYMIHKQDEQLAAKVKIDFGCK